MVGKSSLRMTRQREVLIQELKKLRSHPTADDLYTRVQRRLPRISLGTIYRNLEVLCRFGLIQKIELAGKKKRFDGNLDEHCHIRCVRCGRVDDVPVKPDASIARRIRRKLKYRITGHRLEFMGVCPACAARSRRR